MQNHVIPALRMALSKASLLCSDTSLLAAVSGGADSMALLHGLALLQQEVGFVLCIVHVEHGLRGAASAADAAFVSDACQALCVPLQLYHAKLKGGMNSIGAEARAREARRGFFKEAMAACGASAILTAHHQDDQAETVLMHLLRGAGAKGLSGMSPASPFEGGLLLRPFLSLPGETFPAALRQSGYAWREDESNLAPCCLRNELRLNIFPKLTALSPHAAEHMAQTAEQLALENACLSGMAEQLLEDARQPWMTGNAIKRQPLQNAPKALALRALRLWVQQEMAVHAPQGSFGGEYSLSHEESLRLYVLLVSPARNVINLPGDFQATRTEGYLHLGRQSIANIPPAALPPPQALTPACLSYTLGTASFRLSPLSDGDSLPNGKSGVLLSEPLLHGGLILRTPLPGDMIHPFGAFGSKPLRRYLTDRKVDAPFRKCWPVLACGQNVLWVAGIGAAEKTRLSSSRENCLRLTLDEKSPLPLPLPPQP